MSSLFQRIQSAIPSSGRLEIIAPYKVIQQCKVIIIQILYSLYINSIIIIDSFTHLVVFHQIVAIEMN